MRPDRRPKTLLDHLALWLSVLLSPFLCVPYFCVVFVQATARSTLEFYQLSTLSILLSIGVPALYIAWHVRKGNITDMHVREVEQRKGPFRAGRLSMGSLFACLWLYGAPQALTALAGVLFAQVFVFEWISRSWKVSMHTAVLAACLAGSIEIAGWSTASLLLLLPLCWARRHRGRHLWSQTFAGSALGYGLTAGPLRWLLSLGVGP